jgi:protein involved in polysaccharide export with SLBB domain
VTSATLSGIAQTLPAGADQRSGGSSLEQLMRTKTSAIPTGDLFFEGPVNPDEYIVGPGDRLDIVFWQPTFTENTIVVNGDGDVIIPYVGVVPVASLTLREARAQIETAVSRNLRVAKVSISLLQPRQMRVNVTGLVESPGTYVLPATARISDAIVQAGGIKRHRLFAAGDTTSQPVGSERRIELLDAAGHIVGRADLKLFYSGGQVSANPHLRDGQTIHVPYFSDAGKSVGVFGAVYHSGTFEYADGDRVQDLLILSGGLNTLADSTAIKVVDAAGLQTTIDLKSATGAEQIKLPVEPGTQVYVYGRPDTTRSGSVQTTGQVARPGGYPIIKDQTTLRDLIQLTGGLLPTAAANSARLIRTLPLDPVAPERDRIITASLLASPRGSYFAADDGLAAEFARWNYGTVVVDLSEAAKLGNAAGDIKLQDGDVLEIPSNPLGVRVLGGVNHAGEVTWKANQKLDYYLASAGGVNRAGWKNRTVIIKSRNGSQLRYDKTLPIDPGDVIFIPAKPEPTTWDQIKDFVAVTTQVVTLALVIKTVK